MEDWHRELRKSQAIGGGAWAGSPLPDIDYETGSEARRAIWRFRQIKTGNELFREGQRMHHCVAGYKFACVNGSISIWSLTSEFPIGQVNRGVTLEVTKDGRIVQCRGFANRLPYANEVTMVKRWALRARPDLGVAGAVRGSPHQRADDHRPRRRAAPPRRGWQCGSAATSAPPGPGQESARQRDNADQQRKGDDAGVDHAREAEHRHA